MAFLIYATKLSSPCTTFDYWSANYLYIVVLGEGDIRVRYTIINWNGAIILKTCEQRFSNEFPRKVPSYLYPLGKMYISF